MRLSRSCHDCPTLVYASSLTKRYPWRCAVCQVRHAQRAVRLKARLQRMRRHQEPESPAVIEQKYQAALAEVKRTRPFTIEVGWQSALARLG